jgi:SagB-type dehydrogenase family enzyme
VQIAETVVAYHERTKHHPNRYAASLGYMDWATQPDPFRTFEGASAVALPLPAPRTEPTYGALFHPGSAEALTRQSLSVLLRYALGLAAVKCMNNECWALRCNASSGNLHPTECYVILPPVDGISERSVVAHYAPKNHTLEILHTFDTDFWETLREGSILVGITSIVWREAWKYGERAFRYTQLDAGHALRSLQISARLNGWYGRLVDAVAPEVIETLFGLNQPSRFRAHEAEIPDALLIVSPLNETPVPDLSLLLGACHAPYAGTANLLSPSHQEWEAIVRIENATRKIPGTLNIKEKSRIAGECTQSAQSIILKRRSARAMDFGRTHIGYDVFTQIIASAATAFTPFEPACSFVIFVHDVETLEPGLYLYLLNETYLEAFKQRMRGDFLFRAVGRDLYLLESGDFRAQSKFISCGQEIASDGAFSIGMLCEFAPQLERYGPQRYKSLFWECGAIGQQLYLEATSLGLSATGIGCFLDDVMHRLLGLGDTRFQTLYHFTIGRAVPDLRLQTLKPYAR